MTSKIAYRTACADAAEKKARAMTSLSNAKARISPARLKQDVKNKMGAAVQNGATSVVTTVRERPVAFGAGAAALLLYLGRHPLAALLRRLHVTFKIPHSESDDA